MPRWTEEQTLAINEKGKNIIVSAGAGSGKTAVLSERVLTHIKNGMHIDEMLILTFTNAAAAEMKERIRKKLSNYPELKDEFDKVDLAYITTFDAYALSLVKKYNHLLNISDKVSLIDQSIIDIKKSELLEEIFLEYYEKGDTLFFKLIEDFCLKDDKEIFSSILNMNNSLDNMYNKKSFLESYIEKYYTEDNINNIVNEYEKTLKKKIDSVEKTIENLSFHVDYAYIEKINIAVMPLMNAETYEDIKNNCHVKLPPVPRGSTEEAKAIKKEISNLLKIIEDLTKIENVDKIKNTILNTKDYVTIIIEIIMKLDERLNEFKYQNDAYEFIDISKMAISVLEKYEDVRLELKNKYKEILIDEYQDTNDIQDLFISFIENNNVYMVGDIKQSIYRFRNANPLLFKTKYDNYSNHNGGMKIDLNKNFRSRSDVTENINLIFNLVMNNDIGGADYIKSHQMVFGNTSYDKVNNENYQMEILNYDMGEEKNFSKEEVEIFTIAKDIKNKINKGYKIMDKDTLEERNITYSDFVILMDRSSSFENYKKIFEYLNIPLTIYRDKSISDSITIMLIKNIYNFIVSINENNNDKMFKYSFISIARSYLFNLKDAEILRILNENQIKETEIYKKCKDIADKLNELTNKEIYEKIIDDFDFYNKIITIGNIENNLITIESIGKIIDNVNSFGYTPKEFLKYLVDISEKGLDIKLSLNKEDSNSVKIMTIHASKGLEYHVCYFSGLYKKFNIDDLKNKFYFSNHYGFLTPYLENGPKNTILKILLKDRYLYEEISEKLRLFYVALTRAREKMILVTQLKPNFLAYKSEGVVDDETRLKYLSFNDILNSITDNLEKHIENIDINTLNLTKEYNFKKESDYKKELSIKDKIDVEEYISDVKEIEILSFSKKVNNLYTKEEKDNINLGLKFHTLLEYIDFNNPDYSQMTSYEKNKVEKFINSGMLNNAINVYREYEFIYNKEKNEMHGIIDLLIEYDKTFAIVDYKLKNTKDKDYIKQLNGYKDYIESITNKKVNIYLYSILSEKLEKLD